MTRAQTFADAGIALAEAAQGFITVVVNPNSSNSDIVKSVADGVGIVGTLVDLVKETLKMGNGTKFLGLLATPTAITSLIAAGTQLGEASAAYNAALVNGTAAPQRPGSRLAVCLKSRN